MRSEIRIVVVGDAHSGKTTLISSFLKESFDDLVPKLLPEVSIPAEVTIDKVHTYISDTSSLAEDADLLEAELEKAHVVCLVYSIENAGSYERLGNLWLPLIRSIAPGKPIILVGNKIDLRKDGGSEAKIEQYILPLMDAFKELETCVECSSKELLNVSEVFYFASKAVLHPTSPLYDTVEHKMRDSCNAALSRIFKLCDRDKNQLLDDDELNAFQKKVFGSPLQLQELEGVKEVVRENVPDGVRDNSLTEAGFIYLHLLFIERGRLETIWNVLRKFGYDDDLTLRMDFLHPLFDVPSDAVTELSPTGFQFFTALFQAHDRDKDGVLNIDELNMLFATSPIIPWLNEYRVFESVGSNPEEMTLHKFFAMWSMITLIDHQTTLAYLAYLGFEGDRREAIRILASGRGRGRPISNNRSVFHGLVLGPTGAGKTEFLKGLIDFPFSDAYHPNKAPWTVVNSLDVKGSEKYLVLEEVRSDVAWDILQDEHRLKNTDVLLFLFDTSDPNSFAYLANLRKLCDVTKCPIVFVGTKTDMGPVKQSYEMQPTEYTSALCLAAPIMVSLKDRDTVDLYNIVTEVAMNPSVAIPIQPENGFASLRLVLSLTIVTSALAIGGFVIYRGYRRPTLQQ